MKLVLLALLFSLSCYSQSTVNASNYYEFYSHGKGLKSKKLTTAWLTEAETLTILNEEMEKAGFE